MDYETKRFIKKFNFPKNVQAPAFIPPPDKLKDFEEMCLTFIHFFEEMSGRRVQKEKGFENLVYFFDQGFELDDLIAHVRHQQKAEYYLTNPDRFTVSVLFPIKDPDRCNAVWDQLSYHQSQRTKSDKIASLNSFELKCGHRSDDPYSCIECIKKGDEYEIMKNPYSAAVPDDKAELANFFKRKDEEALVTYAERTFPRRKEINLSRGYKIKESHFNMLRGYDADS